MIILHIKNPKESTNKLLKVISEIANLTFNHRIKGQCTKVYTVL